MNIYVLARLMGHADISILRQYLALVEADLQDAHKQYGAVDALVG
jgi:site-specific recombinase XerD